ncbi:hypothetical protein Pmani_034271 [Petrolisthes manimaculis]|uniref:Uncharacterized protein n=1 Tax=Petrolisthes manimaculis TaxID=1843537 RepID=A0AAE1NN20_9EUCA|nr:hypothetical protein Pmani_034271 [Petrolisthes manimaculis]
MPPPPSSSYLRRVSVCVCASDDWPPHPYVGSATQVGLLGVPAAAIGHTWSPGDEGSTRAKTPRLQCLRHSPEFRHNHFNSRRTVAWTNLSVGSLLYFRALRGRE